LYLRLLSSINIAAVGADVLPLPKAAVVAVVSSLETPALQKHDSYKQGDCFFITTANILREIK
jgi:hypothetical protein